MLSDDATIVTWENIQMLRCKGEIYHPDCNRCPRHLFLCFDDSEAIFDGCARIEVSDLAYPSTKVMLFCWQLDCLLAFGLPAC